MATQAPKAETTSAPKPMLHASTDLQTPSPPNRAPSPFEVVLVAHPVKPLLKSSGPMFLDP
jgi:hypothetical protein